MLRWKGKMYGREVEGTVEAGAIHGSSEVVSIVEALVSGGVRVGLGPWSGNADLTNVRAARATIAGVLDDDTAEFEGDEVPVEPLPEGVEA